MSIMEAERFSYGLTMKTDKEKLHYKKERLRHVIQYLVDDFMQSTGIIISKFEITIAEEVKEFPETGGKRSIIDLVLQEDGKNFVLGYWKKIK